MAELNDSHAGLDASHASTGPTVTKSSARQLSRRKKWVFRILAATVVPTVLLGLLELLLSASGYSYSTRFFVPAPHAVTLSGYGYIANQEFGRQFFPPGLHRQPLSVAIAEPKPEGTFRIFVLGESAALGFPDPSISFSRILEVLLQDRFPNRRFEIINSAMVAINSHVVLPIARDCARHKPDCLVVLAGNNEIVGPFGVSGVISPFTSDLHAIRSSLYVKSTGIGQLFRRTFPTWGQSQGTPRSWKGMSMYMNS